MNIIITVHLLKLLIHIVIIIIAMTARWLPGSEVGWEVSWQVGWHVGWALVWEGLGLGSRTPWPCRILMFLQCNRASGRARGSHARARPGLLGGPLRMFHSTIRQSDTDRQSTRH